jgi:hypothetical protein
MHGKNNRWYRHHYISKDGFPDGFDIMGPLIESDSVVLPTMEEAKGYVDKVIEQAEAEGKTWKPWGQP